MNYRYFKIVSILSAQEINILKDISWGLSNQEIADKRFIQKSTVKSHVRNILNKLGCNTRTDATAVALREGLID